VIVGLWKTSASEFTSSGTRLIISKEDEADAPYNSTSISIVCFFHQSWLMISAVSLARKAWEQRIFSGLGQFFSILSATLGASMFPRSLRGRSRSSSSGMDQDDFAWRMRNSVFMVLVEIEQSFSVYVQGVNRNYWSMKAYPATLLFILLVYSGCSDDGATEIPQEKPFVESTDEPVEPNASVRPEKTFVSSDRDLDDIMGDFVSSIDTYPVIDQAETFVRKNGRTYRRGLEDEPFNGTVVQMFPDGSLSLSTTFYQGKPHGFQKRNFPNGVMAMEVFFDKGILSGTKTRRWENGVIREEEYWSDGKFKGRRLWDSDGRMTREEMVSGN
jgi:hypothetical protein